ncbi:alpha/beta fold hydrolase [Pseudomonas sp. N040]|uniref:alpha/beta fold hydrolase n=1 Tax=Pseudomonas sp. N040 TaxID=2785325 RepID=UPI001C61304B|nr:alpha/beta fold hydrolase [Pseudomonas sp. N040]MBW7013560.1 alpha/beta fold hydrolase [Pseudomonas sp. N040]
MRKLQINGLQMNVLVAGEGEPVLLLHGFPDTHEVWRKQIPALVEAGYQVIAPDTRGCGESQIAPRVADYHRDQLVDDLRALLDALQIDKVRLVAHDWGAVQGWLFTLKHPERVERYIPLSVGHPAAYGSGGLAQKLKGWYVVMFQLRGFPEWLFKAGNWWFFRKFTAFPEEFASWKATLERPGRLSPGINYYRANFDLVLPKAWPKAKVPVSGIVSTGDRYLTIGQMRDSARFVDGPFRYAVVEGANHWLQVHMPEKVNPLLLEFLK